ncbi:MAG: hypothetical protein AB7L66_05885 [Gemmatimonadales bacterium]
MRRWLGAVVVMMLLGGRTAAGQDTVTVIGRYNPADQPAVVFFPTAAALDSIREIMARDLDYSDRLKVITLPAAGPVADPTPATINYALYRALNARIGVEITGTPGAVTIRLHDLLLETLRHTIAAPLDPSGQGEARMAIHRVSDSLVMWAVGRPGIAATRIAFRNRGDGRIYRVDSDGYGVVPISPANALAVSPTWSPDGGRIAYTQLGGEGPGVLILQSVSTGTRVVVPTTTQGQNITPAFSPDGQKLIFSRMTEQSANLYAVNVADLCCLERLTAARFAENLSPVYSPDGRRVAFVSNRAGAPQIYSMGADGTAQELLVPFEYGGGAAYAPDWSPDGSMIVFHREYEGTPQIVTYDLGRRVAQQRTSGSKNEDPSFGPDGTHVVFVSGRTGRGQLHVIDLETGRVRQLMTPGVARLPSWSRTLGRGR